MKLLALASVVFLVHGSVFAQTVAFVDADATPPGTGASWSTAFDDLQEALSAARVPGATITEIWIAEGVYRPEVSGGPLTTSFGLVEGVVLYGGFDGTETSLSERDPTAHFSILSGDLTGNDVPGAAYDDPSKADNTYHVLIATGTTSATGLDGLVIEGGCASNSVVHYNAGGLDVDSGSVTLRNCTFRDNLAYISAGALRITGVGGSLSIEDCLFERNSAGANAGAISVQRAHLSCTNCQFIENGNSSNNGGAIYMLPPEDYTLTLEDCTFVRNKGEYYGGAIFIRASSTEITDCTFDESGPAARGGALYVDASCGSLQFTRVTFSNNEANTWGGGAVRLLLQPGHEATFDDCEFTSNHSAAQGGAIRASGAVTCIDCTFTDNSGQDGGAIHTAKQLNLIGTTFEDNDSSGQGGAVFGEGRTYARDCLFLSNSAVDGGGLVDGGASSHLTNCRFLGNSAVEWGGAIYAHSNSSTTVANSLFSGNSADVGGAIYLYTWPLIEDLTLETCTITGNHAGSEVGGVYIRPWLSKGFLRNSLVWNNTDGAGGTESAQLGEASASFQADWCGIQHWSGSILGTATYGFDPEFVDPLGPDLVAGTLDDDLRLQATSPYRDAGSNDLVGSDVNDIDDDGDVDEILPLDLDRIARLNDDAYRSDSGVGVAAVVDVGAYETPGISPGCSTSRYCLAGTNSLGVGARIHALGSLSLTRGNLTLFAGPCEPVQFGLFFYGAAQIQLPFGDGHRCVGAGGVGLFRLDPALQSDTSGYFTRPIDFSAPPAGSGPGEIAAGATWNFQLWYRDPLGPGGNQFNASDGMSVVLCP